MAEGMASTDPPRCDSVNGERRCQLPASHGGTHWSGGVEWDNIDDKPLEWFKRKHLEWAQGDNGPVGFDEWIDQEAAKASPPSGLPDEPSEKALQAAIAAYQAPEDKPHPNPEVDRAIREYVEQIVLAAYRVDAQSEREDGKPLTVTAHNAVGKPLEMTGPEVDRALADLRATRDDLRVCIDAIHEAHGKPEGGIVDAAKRLRSERDEARAEVERLGRKLEGTQKGAIDKGLEIIRLRAAVPLSTAVLRHPSRELEVELERIATKAFTSGQPERGVRWMLKALADFAESQSPPSPAGEGREGDIGQPDPTFEVALDYHQGQPEDLPDGEDIAAYVAEGLKRRDEAEPAIVTAREVTDLSPSPAAGLTVEDEDRYTPVFEKVRPVPAPSDMLRVAQEVLRINALGGADDDGPPPVEGWPQADAIDAADRLMKALAAVSEVTDTEEEGDEGA